MPAPEIAVLEERIGEWRDFLNRRHAIRSTDVAELEDHLREQISLLMASGLDSDEAFLVAVKRMGDLNALSREFAQEHSERLWKQLVVVEPGEATPTGLPMDAIVAFCLAGAVALLLKIPQLFGISLDDHGGFYARNVSLFVLPLLTGYFVWKRGVGSRTVLMPGAGFVVSALLMNLYPFLQDGNTEALASLHLPIALWLIVGVAYAGDRWRQVDGRMDFIRFSGELFIYYVLIALGGGVLLGFMAMIFGAIGVDVEPFFEEWLPSAAAAGVIVAAWLVEAKQSVIENMAPVLTRLFTPLFAAVLLTFLGTVLWTGRPVDVERDVLIAFDLLLVVVLGLLLYSVSARDPLTPPNLFDVLQVVLVVSALAADTVALWAIGSRISEFGFTPNRVAALGENVILLVNLGWSAVLYLKFIARRGRFAPLERWQTSYLPVYAGWAAIVVIVFPPLFAYI